MPEAAEIVTVACAVPSAGAVSVPLDGVTDRPEDPLGVLAVHVTVAGPDVPRVLSSSTLIVVLSPGATRTCPGLRSRAACVLGGNFTGPAPNDTGASPEPVPHFSSGVEDSVKFR